MLALPSVGCRALLAGSFAGFALLLAACGGSGTALPAAPGSNGVAPGYMRVAFTVAGRLDFSKYSYWVVLNTSGNGRTPEAGLDRVSWAAYSFAFKVDQVAGSPSFVQAIEFIKRPGVPPAMLGLHPTPAQLQYVANGSASGGAFTITFARSLLSGHGASVSDAWLFNAYTLSVDSNVGVHDTMGRCSTCFVSPALDVDRVFDRTVPAQSNAEAIPAAARIVSVAFDNDP